MGVIHIGDPAAGGGQRRARGSQSLALGLETGLGFTDFGAIGGHLAQFYLEHTMEFRDPALLILIDGLVVQMRVTDKNIIHRIILKNNQKKVWENYKRFE